MTQRNDKKSGNARPAMVLGLFLLIASAIGGYALNFVKYSASDYWSDAGEIVATTATITTMAPTTLTVSGVLTGNGDVVLGSDTNDTVTINVQTLNIGSLPTSTNGLASGDIWANSNVLTVFP